MFFRDSAQRREALGAEPGAAERYCLFGLDQLRERGIEVRHNLERPVPQLLHVLDRQLNRGIKKVGVYGGDIAGVLGSRTEANRADVLFSTVDTVGLPLLLLHRAR